MGILAAFLSALFAASKDLVSKSLASRVDSTVSTFASFIYAMPFYLLLLIFLGLTGYEQFQFGSNFIILVLVRSITDCLAEWCKMSALAHAEISLLASFLSLSPVFLLLLSPLFTSDSVGSWGAAGVCLVVAGSIVILYRHGRVPSERERKGIALALLTAFFFALNTCFDKLAVEQSSPTLAGAAMTALAALFFVPFMWHKRVLFSQLRREQGLFWTRGMLELMFMVSKLAALQFLPAAYVMALLRVSLLLSIIGGRVMFHEHGFLRRFIGGLIVLSGIAGIISDLP